VVASWWDYGYWITIVANKTTLADNATANTTQISRIGQTFLSNETKAIKILSSYDATYIVVFTTFDTNGNDVGWGDEGKWRWMARIGGLDDNSFGNYTLGTDWVDINGDGSQSSDELIPNEKGNSTVIYKLMRYGKEITLQGYSTILLEHFEEAYFSQTTESPRNYGGAIPLVCVYKIKYDVTLAINIEGSGSVSLNNTGPYYYGDVVELTAVPGPDHFFFEWSGDLSGSENPNLLTMDSDKFVNAIFTEGT
jgi:asparagine N-glycosylation enzyme membrane subunit Stt3